MKILFTFLLSPFLLLFASDSTNNDSVSILDSQLPKVLTGLGKKALHLVETSYSGKCPKGNVDVLSSANRNFTLHFYDESRNGFFFGKELYIDISNGNTTTHFVSRAPDGTTKNCSLHTANQFTMNDTTIDGSLTSRENCNGIEEQTQENYKLIKNEKGEFTITFVSKKKNIHDQSWKIDKECSYTSSQ